MTEYTCTKEIGFIYNKDILGDDTSWWFDDTSIASPDSSWHNFGYEIIFRLEKMRAQEEVIKELMDGFMKPFRLSPKHYAFEDTFWRIYWDKGQMRASLIKQCEINLDKIAKKNKIAVKLNGIIIQPRPKSYIEQEVKFNSKMNNKET